MQKNQLKNKQKPTECLSAPTISPSMLSGTTSNSLKHEPTAYRFFIGQQAKTHKPLSRHNPIGVVAVGVGIE